MKQFLYRFAFFILSICPFSCKKNSSQPSLVGNWTFGSANYSSYRNDTLLNTVNYTNCHCSIQFNKNGTFVDYYNVAGSYPTDTTSGNYSISGETINFQVTTDRGYLKGLVIPTPVAIFFGGQLDERNVATNFDQITQLSSNSFSVHAIVTSTPTYSNIYKVVVDETYFR